MNKPLDVIVLCEINVDIIVNGVASVPTPGTEHLVEHTMLTAGSSGVLTATGLAALGLQVGVCGLVGDDLFAHYMLEHLDRYGIERSGVVVEPGVSTGVSVILSTTHDRAILTAPEAMAKFSIQQVRLDLLARARHLHLSSYFLQSALQPHVPQLLAQARALGLSTSVDPGFDPAERWQIPGLLQELDFFFPNEVEACAITGETDVRAALEVLAGQTPTVAIKCGAQGTLAAHRNERIHIPAFTVEAVDTTGAGDAFDAGFLAAALAGEDLTTCVRSGNACGALTAAHRGGSGGFTRATVDALLKHQEKGAQYSS